MISILNKYKNNKKCRIIFAGFILFVVLFWISFPKQMFHDPTSTILYSSDGRLLGARIAADGQWRFPETKQVPEKFEKAILSFEDQYFYYHPGVNAVALGRAFVQNIKAGRVVSGGSTISMQLIRISRKGKARNIWQKLIEVYLAIRMECSWSKEQILRKYASHAPFGSNVVGLDAAAWRFFGRSAQELSWAETACLAVLPNAPSLIYPGRNNQKLLNKRNRLLDLLYQKGNIDSTTCQLAKLEEIPTSIHHLPQLAPHLLEKANREHKGESVRSSIDYDLQQRVNYCVAKHQKIVEANQIHNISVLVMDVESGHCLAYVGNTRSKGNKHANQVDVIGANRSTGSVLKPFLYAAMLDAGELLPKTLVPDIPTQIAGYSPKNYDLKFDGAVPADEALSRSLNVPSVRLLRDFGVERFHFLLRKMGMKSLNRPANHYGLSLILGGAEGRLWELTGMYASMSRILNHYQKYDASYFSTDIHPPLYVLNDSISKGREQESALLSAASIYQTYTALLEVNRPSDDNSWKSFSSSQKIAWKTGTSFGFRDAWAIGTTAKYVVGVWAGNADGEGRTGLTGVGVAAPILFDVFNYLPFSNWFAEPLEEMKEAVVCRKSGCLAGRWCDEVDTVLIAANGVESKTCPYHRLIHLDAEKKYQVNSNCESVANMVHYSWFVLPPSMEWYYKKKNLLYRSLPPFRNDCKGSRENRVMELIYPRGNDRVFVPLQMNGLRGRVVFELAHQNPKAEVHWHIDDEFIGTTENLHQMEVAPAEGRHVLTLVDDDGNILEKRFTVVNNRENQLK